VSLCCDARPCESVLRSLENNETSNLLAPSVSAGCNPFHVHVEKNKRRVGALLLGFKNLHLNLTHFVVWSSRFCLLYIYIYIYMHFSLHFVLFSQPSD